MEFEDIGARCSYSYCTIKDFLPFQCGNCNKLYCLKHRTCTSHKCPRDSINDNIMIICPLCSANIKITGVDDPNGIFETHTVTTCNPKNKRNTKKKCSVTNCYTLVTPINEYSCSGCEELKYCIRHRFPDLHNCKGKKSRLDCVIL